MGKFQNGFVKEAKEEEAKLEEQQKLHEKHGVEDENVLVVEKANMTKFTVKTISAIIRTVATVVLLVLAIIGLTAVIYPAPRAELLTILQEIVKTIQTYLIM